MKLNLRKALSPILCLLVIIVSSTSFTNVHIAPSVPPTIPAADMYTTMHLKDSGLSRQAFDCAMSGFENLKNNGSLKNDSILTVIDFSRASKDKRLFVLNLHAGKMMYKTYVSHGKNSGLATADMFSNAVNSNKSSLGFYITTDTYNGKHGYSLRLAGQEKGINDNALARGIVMHCADYVNENLANTRGYIGRSQGCPAVPKDVYKLIIQDIKGGSCLFIYGNDRKYLSASNLLPRKILVRTEA